MEIPITKIDNLAIYAQELNNALREGLGISFHNNNGLLARNPPGIQIANWDMVASFNRWGGCPSCQKQGVCVTFAGIDGPFMEDIFFEEKDKLYFGYRNRISLPEIEACGLRTIPIKKSTVTQWDTEYGPTIGKLESAPEHVHDGQIQAYQFNELRRLSFI